MACYHPIPAWRTEYGRIQLNTPPPGPDNEGLPIAKWRLRGLSYLQLPCGTCIGCREQRAQHWALRCKLESLEHKHTCVTTLTYDDAHLPPTLQRRDLQLWLKRLRKLSKNQVKFYACGEYGEQYGRPHYHVILFGLKYDTSYINDSWVQHAKWCLCNPRQRQFCTNTEAIGLTYTDNVSTEAINYVVNYTNKKKEWRFAERHERLDTTTGELYYWEPPFQIMSRGGRLGHGIGNAARKYSNSWADFAVNNGVKMSVPRYYRRSYEESVTREEYEEKQWKKYNRAAKRQLTQKQLNTKEIIHYARSKAYAALRRYE